MFEDFDFSLLENPNFKEDSVREEIIVPLLKAIGYSAGGQSKIIRSKPLSHPFVYIGSKRHKVNIIPDYLLMPDDNNIWVLDAKAPTENILSGKNPEQVYSYAIHPEIRAEIYALCNGKEISVFHINETAPILSLKIDEFEKKLSEILSILSPSAFNPKIPFSSTNLLIEQFEKIQDKVIEKDNLISQEGDDNIAIQDVKDSTIIINQYGKKETIGLSNALPSNIPSPKGFIGRENDLKTLREAKERGITSFVLHGAGGVGKTDLALKFIEENKTDDRKAYQINMLGLSKKPISRTEAMLEVIRAFQPGVSADLSEADIKSLYTALLNEHKPILFFDNAKDREQVEILNNVSAFTVITSRNTFSVTGGFSTAVEQMSPVDARNLLYSIVEENRFEGEADNLAYRAGYLPMALLPLASMLVEDITLEAKDLVKRYSDRKESLKLKDPNRENLSVEASFDLSYETLSDGLKSYWQMLSIFPSDFDLQAMEAIWQIDDGKKIRSELIKKHLLEFNQESKRSRLHDLARFYAREKSTPKLRSQSAYRHSRHFAYYLNSLKELSLSNLAKFDLERVNIEQGFKWLNAKVEQHNDFALLSVLYVDEAVPILAIRLHSRELINWMEIGLKVAEKLGITKGKAIMCCNLGFAYQKLGEYRKAIAYGEQALQIAKEVGDLRTESTALNNQGNSYQSLGEYEKAIRYFEQSLDIANKINDLSGQASCLCNLGISYGILREYKIAAGFCEKSLEIATQISDLSWKALSLGNLGIIYKNLQDYERAEDFHEQALKIAKEMGDRHGICIQLGSLANLFSSLGNYRKSVDFLYQSYEIAKEIGDRKQEGICLGNLGNSYFQLGDPQRAEDFWEKAIIILELIEAPEANSFRRNLTIIRNQK